MSMDGGLQAVRAAGENLQIRTPIGWWKIKKKMDIQDPARGQAYPGSAAVYTMDWPGPVNIL
jgi:hypothetical protein